MVADEAVDVVEEVAIRTHQIQCRDSFQVSDALIGIGSGIVLDTSGIDRMLDFQINY